MRLLTARRACEKREERNGQLSTLPPTPSPHTPPLFPPLLFHPLPSLPSSADGRVHDVIVGQILNITSFFPFSSFLPLTFMRYGYNSVGIKIPEGYLNIEVPLQQTGANGEVDPNIKVETALSDSQRIAMEIYYPPRPGSVYHMTKVSFYFSMSLFYI
jgi:hypothetical protein